MRKINIKRASEASEYIRKGIDFNLNLGNNKFIMFVGGILSKLENGRQYFAINGKWIEC